MRGKVLAAAPAALAPPRAQSADAKQRAQDRLDVYTAVVQAQQMEVLNAGGYDVTAARQAAGGVEVQVILTKGQRAKLSQEGIATSLTRVKGGMTVKEFAAAQ